MSRRIFFPGGKIMWKSLVRCMFVLTIVVFVSPNLLAGMQTLSFGGTPNYYQTLTFDQYDGDLSNVMITMDFTVTGGSVSADNEGAEVTNISLEIGANAMISSLHVPLINDAFQPVLGSGLSLSNTYAGFLAGDDGDGPGFQTDGTDWALLELDVLSGSASGFVNSSLISLYEGNGTFDIVVNISQIMSIASYGGITGCFTPVMTDGTVTVDYNVPEPITIALLGFGGLMICRRRSSKS